MATKMAQLNVRMDPELKAAGDSVLDLYRISPSELVRAVWEKVAIGKNALRQIIETLAAEPTPASVKRSRKENALKMIERIERRQAEFEKEFGLDPSTYVAHTDEELEDLVYEDYLEKWRERENQSAYHLD